jgi:hypothetical protein
MQSANNTPLKRTLVFIVFPEMGFLCEFLHTAFVRFRMIAELPATGLDVSQSH